MSNARLTTASGVSFITKGTDYYISKSIELYGEWSFGEIDLFKTIIKPNDNIIEVGSNIGAHTVFLALDVCQQGKIFAFEPRRILFQILCGNLSINNVENVYTYCFGLGEEIETFREKKLEFNHVINAGGISLGTIPGHEEMIEIKKLDDVIDPTEKISLIKADIEGFELKFLKGAKNIIKINRPYLYLENDDLSKSQALIQYLWDINYEIWWHIVPLFNPNNRAKTQQNIFEGICSLNIVCSPCEKYKNFPNLQKVDNKNFHPVKS